MEGMSKERGFKKATTTPASTPTHKSGGSVPDFSIRSTPMQQISNAMKRRTEGHVPKLTKPLPKPAAPPTFKGHLYKESPSLLAFQRYKWRYIVVRDSGVQWWQSVQCEQAGKKAKGRLDFAVNPCEVTLEDTILVVRPSGGNWVDGDFTGAERGRELRFSCNDSEYKPEEWKKALNEHIEYGKAWRVRATMVAQAAEKNKRADDSEADSFQVDSESDSDSSASSFSNEKADVKEEAPSIPFYVQKVRWSSYDSGVSEPPKVLVWNIEAFDHESTNILEFLPATGVLGPSEESTLNQLLQQAVHVMARPDKSPRLLDLLCNRPIEEAGVLEKAPITKIPSGLATWLCSRLGTNSDLFHDLTPEEAAAQWCEDFTVRWEFWKHQTLHEWLCDDGSGGVDDGHFIEVLHPTITDSCSSLSICAADHVHRRRPPRGVNDYLRASVDKDFATTPESGEHDFFKLLVWDLAVNTLLSHVVNLDKMLELIKEETAAKHGDRFRSILDRVEGETDIALLLGAPAGLLDVHDECISRLEKDFWAVSSPDDGHIRIFARKCYFDMPSVQRSPCKGAILCCTMGLVPKELNKELHVIACHATHEDDIVGEVEAALTPCTILGGSLWKGNLHEHQSMVDSAKYPKLSRLLLQVDGVVGNLGSVCRKRSPLQAQVTKMMTTEVELHEFVFLGEDFHDSQVEGLLSADQCLPDATRHAALTTVAKIATVCL